MIVFADTSALVSLFNPDDSNHARAKLLARKVKSKFFLISDYIFAETVTILSQKVGKEKSIDAGELMKTRFKQIRINEDEAEIAWDIFKKQKSKNVSFFDCTTIALFQKGVFDKLFTFDADFQKNKVSVLV